MKTLLYFLFLLFIPCIAPAQGTPSSCNAPDSIVAKYRDDADMLAIHRLKLQNSPLKDSVKIPQEQSDSILKTLLAVYNASSIPARDTVVKILYIHARSYRQMTNLTVSADSSLPWMQKLRAGIFPTGNTIVDKLFSQYGLSVEDFRRTGYNMYHMVFLQSDNNYNMDALAEKFKDIQGVEYAQRSILIGDGSYITYSVQTDRVLLEYSYGWGDCPAGCTKRRNWKFKVYSDCSVDFAGSYGDILYSSGLNSFNKQGIDVFPNPFTDELTVKGLEYGFSYGVSNLLGQQLLSGSSEDGSVNLEQLPAGAYVLKIETGNSSFAFRIMKN